MSGTRHGPVAQLLLASSPLTLVLVAYVVGDWIDAPIHIGDPGSVNRLGAGLHPLAAATVDRHLFGTVPTVWLQQRLLDVSPHWYDAAASLLYASHVVAIPLVTVVVWFRCRARYRAWIAAVLAFIVVGVAGYVAFPASPPWLASRQGLVGPVTRSSDLGWAYLHLAAVGHLVASTQSASNPIAAMPSLHAGSAMLVALFLWPLTPRRWRGPLAAYPVAMALALVYTGEHYGLDVLAGWLTAAIGAAVGASVATGFPPAGGVGCARTRHRGRVDPAATGDPADHFHQTRRADPSAHRHLTGGPTVPRANCMRHRP